MSPPTDRIERMKQALAIELTRKVQNEKSDIEKRQEFTEKINKLMSYRILKICIQKNSVVRLQRQ